MNRRYPRHGDLHRVTTPTAEYRALEKAATAQSGRRYVRTEVIADAAEHAAIGEDPAGFTSAGDSPGANFIDSAAIS
jgi:hypothetical protein